MGVKRSEERRIEIAIVNAPRQIETNETAIAEEYATPPPDANETASAVEPPQEAIAMPPATPVEPPYSPPKLDGLQRTLIGLGYPFANGDLQKSSCANGQTCAVNGVLHGLNFAELYCRAVAFSQGREMPKYAPSASQNFETMQFWLSKKPAGLDAIYLVSDPFALSGSLFADRGALKGSLSLSYSARWRFPCEMSESWQSVALPLRCVARRRQPSLDCSLDLRALIESLSGVAAKASEPTQRKQIDQLHENLQEQFKRRIRERPNIEEIDLRYLF
jgi:hypothetical protein